MLIAFMVWISATWVLLFSLLQRLNHLEDELFAIRRAHIRISHKERL